jgi:hypothetical protein
MTAVSRGPDVYRAHLPASHTLSHDQLILGPRRVGDAVVGLDKLAWRRAGISANRVPRWWRQHAGIGGQSSFERAGGGMIARVPRLVGGPGLLTTWLLRCKVLLVNHYTARADTGMTGRVGRLCVCRDMRPRVRSGPDGRSSRGADDQAWRMRRRNGLASHLDVACAGFLGASTVRDLLRCAARCSHVRGGSQRVDRSCGKAAS